jgi:hypothetical protein
MITIGIDWDKWRHIPNPKIWEATLLLMGIDPDRYAKVNDPEYDKKLRILCANYCTIEGKPDLNGNDASPDARVNLSRCAEWAATRWKILPELSGFGPPKAEGDVLDKDINGRASRTRCRPIFERALAAIQALYPNGVPSPVDVPNSVLCRNVGDHLKIADKKLNVSNDTILRAAKRRRN